MNQKQNKMVTSDVGTLLLGMFLVLGIPLAASFLPWSKIMISVSAIKYVVALVFTFLTGAVPVFLAQWTPTDLRSWLTVVLAGLAAVGTYHVPSPLQAARKRLRARSNRS